MSENKKSQIHEIISPRLKPTVTINHQDALRSARKAAAAKALAEQFRLGITFSQPLTSSDLNSKESEKNPKLQGNHEKHRIITSKQQLSPQSVLSPVSVEPITTHISNADNTLQNSLNHLKYDTLHSAISPATSDTLVSIGQTKALVNHTSDNSPNKRPAIQHGNKILLQEIITTDNSIQTKLNTSPVKNIKFDVPPSSGLVASPTKFSPNNFARRDVRFEVQLLSAKEQTIESGDHKQQGTTLFLEWKGESGEALKIIMDDQEYLSVKFETIQRISYNPSGQHVQLVYNTPANEQPQTLIIAMKNISSENWTELQQLLRQVEKKWKVKCDQENMTFFHTAIQSMTKKPYKKMENPYVNRSDTVSKQTGTLLRKVSGQRQVMSNLYTTTPKRTGAIRTSNSSPKKDTSGGQKHRSFGSQIKNILAAKVIDKPHRIPHLITPSRAPSVTESLLSRLTESPLNESYKSHRGSISKDVNDNGSSVTETKCVGSRPLPSKERHIGSPIQLQASARPETPEPANNHQDFSSLFGSEDSDHSSTCSIQSEKTPSQRFKDQINEAKISSSKACTPLDSIGFDSPQCYGSQIGVNLKSDSSILNQTSGSRSSAIPAARILDKPERGFKEFMDTLLADNLVQEDSDSENGQHDSFIPNVNAETGISPRKLSPILSKIIDTERGPKRSRSCLSDDSTNRSSHPSKKCNEPSIREKSTGLYYMSKSGQDYLLPVAINDEIIRLRTKADMQENGKQSKYDVFDGPWVVLEISDKAFPLWDGFFDVDEESSDSAASRQAEWDNMLTTKLKLNFPEGSKANPWVELSQLIPVIDPHHIVTGTLLPSSLEVSQHGVFRELVAKLNQQQFDQNSRNSFVKKTIEVANDVYVVELRKGKFIAFMDIDSKGLDTSLFEVSKIRQKRLRLYTKTEARKIGVKQYNEDKWVMRLLTHYGDIAHNRVIVDEYLVHWAGWPVEDQSWIPRSNFGDHAQVENFDRQDQFRSIPDNIAVSIDDMVYKGDLRKARAALRKGKRRSSGDNNRSSGGSSRSLHKDLD